MSMKKLIYTLLCVGIAFHPYIAHAEDGTPVNIGNAILADINRRIPVVATVDNLKNHGCKSVTADNNNVVTVPGGMKLVKLSGDAKVGRADLYFVCPESSVESITKPILPENPGDPTWLEKLLMDGMALLFKGINFLVGLVLSVATKIFNTIIGESSFIGNDIVKQGWPFIQGVANLGFIFALLYIALATTLRMESVGASIQRLLPKLLIGALLVNFSLVIGGVLIDTSRLVMALEINLVGGVNKENLLKKLVDQTAALKNQTASLDQKFHLDGSKDTPQDSLESFFIKQLLVTSTLVALCFGIFIISVNLFIRYIAILILLIFSPLAYLAIALPQTTGYAKQWWSMFLKWVAYGPIVLFFLAIILRLQSTNLLSVPKDGLTNNAFMQRMIQFIVVISLLYIAHVVGKKAAGAGSSAVMGFAAKNPRTALVAAGAMTGGLLPALGLIAGAGAARYAGRTVANNARDFTGDIKSNLIKKTRSGELFGKDSTTNQNIPSRLAKWAIGPERDDKGKRKPGEMGTVGSYFADKVSYLKPQAAKDALAAMEKLGALKTDAEKAAFFADQQTDLKKPLHSSKLLDKKVAVEFSEKQLDLIGAHAKPEQILATTSHKDVVRKMSKETRNNLYMSIDPKIAKQMQTRMRDLTNEK